MSVIKWAALVSMVSLCACSGGNNPPLGVTSSVGSSSTNSMSVSASASSSGGAATSSSSSGGTTGGCASVSNELAPCQTDCECAAPLTCVLEPTLAVSLCELPCEALSDCPSFTTICNDGACHPVPCGPAFGGDFDAPCGSWPDGGTCLPYGAQSGVGFDWQTTGLCSEGGSLGVSDTCTPGETRSDPATGICQAGDVCGPLLQCGLACNPTVPNVCLGEGDQTTCETFEQADPLLGICQDGETGFGDGGLTCEPVGGGCDTYEECCNLTCGYRHECCSLVGGPCWSSTDCCNLHRCSNALPDAGGPPIDAGVCLCEPSASGVICHADADCCSGVCDATVYDGGVDYSGCE